MVVLAGLWLFLSFSGGGPQATELTFTELEQRAGEGLIATAVFREQDQVVEGELSTGASYEATYPLEYQDELTEKLRGSGVEVSADPQKGSAVVGVLLNILPFLLIFGFIIFLMRQGQGGGGRVMSFGTGNDDRCPRLIQQKWRAA